MSYKHLLKPLWAGAEAAMKRIDPSFTLNKKHHMGTDIRLYQRNFSHYTAFVMFQVDLRHGPFTVELGGDIVDLYPASLDVEEPWGKGTEPDYQIFIRDSKPTVPFRLRLGKLWLPYRDVWWPITSWKEADIYDTEACLRDILNPPGPDIIKPDLVEQSLAEVESKLRAYAIPFFDTVNTAIERHGMIHQPIVDR